MTELFHPLKKKTTLRFSLLDRIPSKVTELGDAIVNYPGYADVIMDTGPELWEDKGDTVVNKIIINWGKCKTKLTPPIILKAIMVKDEITKEVYSLIVFNTHFFVTYDVEPQLHSGGIVFKKEGIPMKIETGMGIKKLSIRKELLN